MVYTCLDVCIFWKGSGQWAMIVLLALVTVGLSEQVAPSPDPIKTFQMHTMCGQEVNMRRRAIFTASVQFDPSHHLNTTSGLPGNPSLSSADSSYQLLDSCDILIESWSFQNRIMFYFNKIHIHDDCTHAHIEILDGPTIDSPNLPGLPRFICNGEGPLVERQVFVTTDKHMTIRFHHDGNVADSYFEFVVVSFHDGQCMSNEYECANQRCIIEDVVCNGHNPCGDNSDCPQPLTSQPEEEVMAEDDGILLKVIICISSAVVLVLVGAVVLYRVYKIKRKHRRHSEIYISTPSNCGSNVSRRQRQPLRPESQIEAERLASPPSYNSLPLTERNPENEQSNATLLTEEECRQPEGSTEPPPYACVMLHKDLFRLSDLDVRSNSKDDGDET